MRELEIDPSPVTSAVVGFRRTSTAAGEGRRGIEGFVHPPATLPRGCHVSLVYGEFREIRAVQPRRDARFTRAQRSTPPPPYPAAVDVRREPAVDLAAALLSRR